MGVRESWVGSSNTTKTFATTMSAFAIVNNGASDLTFTIGDVTVTVKAGQSFDDSFYPFTQVIINTTVAYQALVRG